MATIGRSARIRERVVNDDAGRYERVAITNALRAGDGAAQYGAQRALPSTRADQLDKGAVSTHDGKLLGPRRRQRANLLGRQRARGEELPSL
jgi:hypothetical protein